MKTIQSCLTVAALAGALLSTSLAHAEEDGPRFRGGISLEGGALLPSHVALGAVGPQGQLGVQVDNLLGIYAVPAFDILFGPAGGVDLTFAVMADFTLLDDVLTVGGGLDSGVFAAIGGNGTSAAAAAGAQYGVRGHAAWNALVTKGPNGIRRKALVVGLDLRFLVGPEGSETVTATGGSVSASTHGFVFSPMVTVGYVAF